LSVLFGVSANFVAGMEWILCTTPGFLNRLAAV